MAAASLLDRSHQHWKMWAFYSLMALALTLMILGEVKPNIPYGGVIGGVGAMVGVMALFFGSLSIRCPSCGDKWFWRAISKLDNKLWLGTLQRMSECPQCGYGKSAL